MIVREMSQKECYRFLAEERFARLACAQESQPYVVPVSLVYHEESGCLYGFTTPGQKVEWMRANPLVCVELDRIASYDQWVSVIVFGRFEELSGTAGSDGGELRHQEHARQVGERQGDDDAEDERQLAWKVLKTHPAWAEPACTVWASRPGRESAGPFSSVFYRIRIDRITGHEASRRPPEST